MISKIILEFLLLKKPFKTYHYFVNWQKKMLHPQENIPSDGPERPNYSDRRTIWDLHQTYGPDITGHEPVSNCES